jgi:cyclophilin family peptidyl-prolyl cis-trans isomerase
VGTAKRERQKANRQLRLEQLQKQQAKQKRNKTVIRVVIGAVVFVGLAVGISWLVSGRGGGSSSANGSTTTLADAGTTVATASTVPLPSTVAPAAKITGDTPCPAADGSSPRTVEFAKAPPMCIDVGKTYTVTMKTNKGDMTMVLDPKKAPQTVNNFVVLANYHYFDNTICHRIIPSFVVQCGDPSGDGTGNNGQYPGYTIPDELPKQGDYKVGSLAMANTGQPNSGGSQFFIITGDQGVALPPSYSLFGQVTDGLTTTLPALDKLGNPNNNGVPPLEQVVIESVTVTPS